MSENNDLPIHPRTGFRALAIGKRGPWWPVAGGSGEGGDSGTGGDSGGDNSGTGDDPATGSPNPADDPKPTETVDHWKQKARDWETRSKANAKAATQLAEANARATEAEAEVATLPVKVAEALKAHLVGRHGIGAEEAELFLTATDPELLLRQVDGLLGQPGKRRKNNNYVPDQGNGKLNAEKPSPMREFTRQLFGNDT